MNKPLRKCRYPGCRVLTADGYCPEHKPKQVRKASAAWHYLYTDPRYGWEYRRSSAVSVLRGNAAAVCGERHGKKRICFSHLRHGNRDGPHSERSGFSLRGAAV